MPFVRFSRDRRGYEHTYLVHESGGRGRPTRARVLYWFRTPPGIKVGREPFDDEVRRRIESKNPGLAFDWKAIASTPMPPVPEVEHWRERRRVERAAKVARREEETDAAVEAAATDGETTPPEVPVQSLPVDAMEIIAADPESSVTLAQDAESPLPQEDSLPRDEANLSRKRRRRRGGRRRRVAGDPIAGSGCEDGSSDAGALPAAGESEVQLAETVSSRDPGASTSLPSDGPRGGSQE